MNKKIPFLIALITILFLAGIVVVLTLNMQEKEEEIINNDERLKETEEIDNWITYRDEDYGFEINYPNDWMISDKKCNAATALYFEPKESDKLKYICLGIIKNKEGLSIKEWHQEMAEKLGFDEDYGMLVYYPFINLDPTEELVIDGYTFYKFKIPHVKLTTSIAGTNGKYVFDIMTYEYQEDIFEIQDEMALTLKFLDTEKEGQVLHGPFYSQDKEDIAYIHSLNDKQFIVLNNKEHKKYDKVSDPIFGTNGRFAYIAKENDKYFTVLNGEEQKKYDNVDNLVFGGDGKHFAYLVENQNEKFIIFNGEEQKTLQYVCDCIEYEYKKNEFETALSHNLCYREKGYYTPNFGEEWRRWTLLAIEHIGGSFKCPFEIKEGLVYYVSLGITGEPDFYITSIFHGTQDDIKVYDENKNFLQQIKPGNENIFLGWAMFSHSLNPLYFRVIKDINFDGYNDIVLMSVAGMQGTFGVETWLYNPSLKKFERNETLSKIYSPIFLREEKKIISTIRGSHGRETDEKYSFINEEYILTERETIKSIGLSEGIRSIREELVEGELKEVERERGIYNHEESQLIIVREKIIDGEWQEIERETFRY